MGNKIVAAGGKGARVQKARHDTWTPGVEKAFLTELAITANITASLKFVGMSAAGLYMRRKRHPAFMAAWDCALSEGYARLEAEMLYEALHGVAVPVTTDGEVVIERRPAPPGIRLTLLKQHGQHVAAIRAEQRASAEDTAALRKKVMARLERIAASLEIPGPGATA